MGRPWYPGSKSPLLSRAHALMQRRVASHRLAHIKRQPGNVSYGNVRFMEGWITCSQTAGEQSPTIAFCLNVNLCNCLAIPGDAVVVQRNNPMLFSAASLSLSLSEAWLKICLTWPALRNRSTHTHTHTNVDLLPHSNA